MQLSEQTNELFSALAKFHADCPEIYKDAEVEVRNKQGKFLYKFYYATLGNMIRTTKPVLAENGLSVVQSNGNDGVKTIVTHSSGQYLISDTLKIEPKTYGDESPSPQDIGSATTYSKRYSYASTLNIDSENDDDGNMASGNDATVNKKQPKTKKEKSKPTKKSEPEPKTEEDTIDSLLKQCKEAKTKQEAIQIYQKAMDLDRETALSDPYKQQWGEIIQSL